MLEAPEARRGVWITSTEKGMFHGARRNFLKSLQQTEAKPFPGRASEQSGFDRSGWLGRGLISSQQPLDAPYSCCDSISSHFLGHRWSWVPFPRGRNGFWPGAKLSGSSSPTTEPAVARAAWTNSPKHIFPATIHADILSREAPLTYPTRSLVG